MGACLPVAQAAGKEVPPLHMVTATQLQIWTVGNLLLGKCNGLCCVQIQIQLGCCPAMS